MTDRSATSSSDGMRDPHLDSLWRAASTEAPAPTLDSQIVALAHGEADAVAHTHSGAASASKNVARHWWPLAAAATIGALAFGIVQMWPAEHGERVTVSDMPAPAAHAPTSSSIAAQPGSPSVPATAPATAAQQPKIIDAAPAQSSEAVARRNASKRQDSSQPLAKTMGSASGPAANGGRMKTENAASDEIARTPSTASDNALPFVPDPKPALQARAAAAPAEMRREQQASPSFNDAPAPVNAPAAAPRALGEMDAEVAKRDRISADAPARLPTADWIALIRRLRDEGKVEDAKRELASFRRAHSNAESLLPADLREWQPAR